MKRSIEKLRLEYGNTPLLEEALHPDPLHQFQSWFNDALEAEVMEPNGMILATVTSAGRPASRTVLLKKMDGEGFCFYSHYTSRKGEHLDLHPFGALTFWWKELFRQVNIEGTVQKTSRQDSADYFSKRPKGAQLAAHASNQSTPLASREQLEEVFERLQKKYRGKEVPLPKDWGGYRLMPERMEFWQGRQNRLHDRFVYVKAEGSWLLTRLSP